MRMLAPLWHAVLDYGLAILFLIAPALFGFESAAARSLAHAIGATYIVASLVTRYPLGLLKLLPFPAHGVLETLAALGWLVLPYLAGFAGDRAARNFFVATAIALLAVVSITDYRAVQPGGERRRRKKDRRLRPSHVMADRRMTLLPRRAQ